MANVSKVNLNKIKQTIRWYGSEHKFSTTTKNKFKEPTDQKGHSITVQGLYHQGSTSWVSLLTEDAGTIQSKDMEYIAVVYSEVAAEISQGHEVTIDGTNYKVNGINNIGKLNIILEISLERVI